MEVNWDAIASLAYRTYCLSFDPLSAWDSLSITERGAWVAAVREATGVFAAAILA